MKLALCTLAAAATSSALMGWTTDGGVGSGQPAASQVMMTISGSIAYHGRMALLPGSTARVALNDATLTEPIMARCC